MASRRVFVSVSAAETMPWIANSITWMSSRTSGDRSQPSIRELVTAAKQGDLVAFGSLVDLYQPRVYRTARGMLGSDSDACDAVQEVFIKAYRSISGFDESRDIAPWLYKITANVCRDIARATLRHRGAHVDGESLISTSLGPFESATKHEQQDLVRRALVRLPYKERAAITLRDLEGLSTREVARILGTTEATVRSQVSSGRARLRQSILGTKRRDP